MPRVRLLYELVHVLGSRVSLAERYAAMLDQVEYGDRNGFACVRLHEHHGAHNHYLSSPVTAAAAVAARTKSVRIRTLLLVLLYDPIKLAEDAAVVDLLSGGRYEVILASGYRAEEFEMFGKTRDRRRTRVDAVVPFLRQAWTGEPFAHEGRTVCVTPVPARDPHPPILLAGGTEAAARSAARIADGFEPNAPQWWDVYRRELRALGKADPGPLPPAGPTFLHISQDPERDWHEIAPRILAMMHAYRDWATHLSKGVSHRFANPPDRLDFGANPAFQVVTPDDAVKLLEPLGADGRLDINPMWGGVEPDMAWSSLELLVNDVLPRLLRPTGGRVATDPVPPT